MQVGGVGLWEVVGEMKEREGGSSMGRISSLYPGKKNIESGRDECLRKGVGVRLWEVVGEMKEGGSSLGRVSLPVPQAATSGAGDW